MRLRAADAVFRRRRWESYKVLQMFDKQPHFARKRGRAIVFIVQRDGREDNKARNPEASVRRHLHVVLCCFEGVAVLEPGNWLQLFGIQHVF